MATADIGAQQDLDGVDRFRLRLREPALRKIFDFTAIGLGAFFFQQLWWPAPLGVLVQGVVIGGLTALIAFGMALVYRANRIINFAQADLGGAPAVLAVLLIAGPGFNYFLALGLGLGAAILLGGAVEFLIIRRFFKAPRLILTVATIGLAQLLGGLQVAMPRILQITKIPESNPSPWDFSFRISPIVFGTNDVLAMIAIPVAIAGLYAFFRFTHIGIAVRASAESSERASLLGVPVKRLNTIVWVIATVLSTVGIFLRAGIVGLPLGGVIGPAILLRALAAAVIGRMERFGTIFAAAVGLGIVEQAVFWDTGRASLADPILFAIILGVLLVQRRGDVSRAFDSAATSWRSAALVRRVPRELAVLPEVRVGTRAIAALGWGALLASPLVASESQSNLIGVILIFAIVGISLVILTGWAGQISLGHMAFVAIGAAVAAFLTSRYSWDLSLALLAAGVVGAAVATIIGLPALRLRGLFLAAISLAFALAVSSYFVNPQFFSWVATERVERLALFGRVSLESETRYFYLVVAGFYLATRAARGIRNSRVGRVLIATRENEKVTQAAGVSVSQIKLLAFALSGFLAAFAGGLFVHHQNGLLLTSYQPEQSLRAFAMVVIGGLGSVPGAVLGAAYVRGFDFFVPADLRFLRILSTGVGLLVMLLVLPGGLGSVIYTLRDRALRVVADRRRLIFPSLFADAAARPEGPSDRLDEPHFADVFAGGADPMKAPSNGAGRTDARVEV